MMKIGFVVLLFCMFHAVIGETEDAQVISEEDVVRRKTEEMNAKLAEIMISDENNSSRNISEYQDLNKVNETEAAESAALSVEYEDDSKYYDSFFDDEESSEQVETLIPLQPILQTNDSPIISIQLANVNPVENDNITIKEETQKVEIEVLPDTTASSVEEMSSVITIEPRIDLSIIRPDDTVIKSDGYPKPYPKDWQNEMLFDVSTGTGIEIRILDLDIDPATDYLYIRGGDENDHDEQGFMLTGKISEPAVYRILHTNKLFIQFVANQSTQNTQYKGYRLAFSPFGVIPTPSTPTTPDPLFRDLEKDFIIRNITVPEERLTEEESPALWQQLREIISNGTNQYMLEKNITAEASETTNVQFKAIKMCPKNWRHSKTCVQIEFAVPVRLEKNITIEGEDLDEPDKYEMSRESLDEMWELYIQKALEDEHIHMYNPGFIDVLAIWMASSLIVIALLTLTMCVIWKTGLVRDYRRMNDPERENDNKDEKDLKDFDISMYPSPYQNVPTLFPTNEGPIGGHTNYGLEEHDDIFDEDDDQIYSGQPQSMIYPKSNLGYTSAPNFNEPSYQPTPVRQENIFQPDMNYSDDDYSQEPKPTYVRPPHPLFDSKEKHADS